MSAEQPAKPNWFHRNPKKTILLFVMLVNSILILSIEKILEFHRYIQEFKGDANNTTVTIKRTIKLREHLPRVVIHDTPNDHFMEYADNLQVKEYVLRTDDNGFILPSKKHDAPDLSLVFLGGSTTECFYVDEDMRFPYLVGNILEAETGLKVNSYNGSYSGNNSMHSLNALINKVIPLNPDVVIMMHNFNDLTILLYEKTYWNDNPSRSLVEIHKPTNKSTPKLTITRVFKGMIFVMIPNLYLRLVNLKNQLKSKFTKSPLPLASVDEFAYKRGKQIHMDRNSMLREFGMSLRMFIYVCKTRGFTPVLMTQANRFTRVPDKNIFRLMKPLRDFGISYDDFKSMYDAFNEKIRDLAAEQDVLLIDLAKAIPQEKEYMFDVIHYNNVGSKLAASIISNELVEGLNLLHKQAEVSRY